LKVSIITVCHNQLRHTKRFVASLKRYTPQEPIAWDLTIIDSGSTDGTEKWFYGEASEKHFYLIPQSEPNNIGWIKGINRGLEFLGIIGDELENKINEIPKPDILIFANNDIVLDSPGWLERLCKHFDNPTVGAVGPTSNYVIGRQHTSCNVPHIVEEETKTIVGLFFAVRREIVDQIGGLNERLADYIPDYPDDVRENLRLGGADDLDYSRRIREAGWRLVIARDVFVWHAGSSTFKEVMGQEGYTQQWQAADVAYERKWGPGSRAECFDNPVKQAIGLPMRSTYVNWQFSKALCHLEKPPGWLIVEAPRGIVDQSRNKIVELALQHGLDWLLFLDDDHTFPHDLWYRLMSHQKDVVGALCFRRIEPFGPCIFRWQTDPATGNLMVYDRPDLIKKGLQRVDGIGFGAVLIKMEVFKRLGPAPWFKFSEVGEDLHFCDLCAQNGIEVWCDTDLIAPHINDNGILVTEQTYFEYHQHRLKGAAV
jgi:GT2 family glycosyltransferase